MTHTTSHASTAEFDPFGIDSNVDAFLAVIVDYSESLGNWIVATVSPEWLIALGIGALAGWMRARIIVAVSVIAGGGGAWILFTGSLPETLPPGLVLAVAILGVLGIVEGLVILIGGREAAPQFWATVLAGSLIFVFLFPLRVLGWVAAIIPGARALKSVVGRWRLK